MKNKFNLKNFAKTKKFSYILWLITMILSFFVAELFNTNIIFLINPLRILINLIIIFIINAFVYSLTGKIRLSAILSNCFIFVLSLANYVVYCFRGTPLDPLDILSIGTGISVALTYKLTINLFFIGAIILFVISIYLCTRIKYNPRLNKKNIISRLSFLLGTVALVILLFNTSVINYIGLYTNLWKPKQEYETNGFIASFLKQSVSSIRKAPKGYSDEALDEITKNYLAKETFSYDEPDTPENSNEEIVKPNVIVIMNESFSDMSVHRKLNTNKDYLSYYKKFTKNIIHGNVHSSVYGGKTPNAEWEFLTNNSMAFLTYGNVPYQQYIHKPTTSLVSTMEAQGYTSYAIHPYYGSGYRRNSVYPLLGFDHYYFLEDMQDEVENIREYASDLSAYKKLINLYENKGEDELFFNFTITMQNHSGYDYVGYEPTITLKDIPNCPRAEQYLSVVNESDKALEYLINYFKKVEEPTVILMFGDHQPPYLEQEFWDYLNKNKTDSLADAEIGYLTPYFIWTNYKIDVKEFQKKDISTNYLSNLLLDVSGLEKTPYMEFLSDMQKEIPVITGHGYMDKTGTYHSLDEVNEYSKLIKNYEFLVYNHLFDNKNKVQDFFTIPKEIEKNEIDLDENIVEP